MNDATNAKQQIVERIKNSTNILVTVSNDPSVDQLSAALGLTVLLNKLNKHATAVVSGELPSAMAFLDPEKTFENTVDSLRDFIIALDKEKADHLRYKVDGDVVKIFITPYRTTISSEDLDFSQGDYNVELVLGLGVKDRDHLDTALSAHGRILHDATVATLSAGENTSDLGSIDWHDDNASSLSEMLVSLSEALKSEKPVLDEQVATALLTGIVAATDRFSNSRTSSRVMTMAAQLMAAGANQQLIAAKLQEAHAIGPDAEQNQKSQSPDGTTDLTEGQSTKLDKKSETKKKSAEKKKNDGDLVISHEKQGSVEDVASSVTADNQADAAKTAEEQLAAQLETTQASPTNVPSVADLQQDLASASADVEESASQASTDEVSLPAPEALRGAVSGDDWRKQNDQSSDEPRLGGTLNATTEQAADDKRREEADSRNHTILTHNNGDYVGDSQPTFQSPINGSTAKDDEPATVDPFRDPSSDAAATARAASVAPLSPAQSTQEPELQYEATEPARSAPTLAEIDQQNRASHDEARAAVEQALNAAPFEPAGNPQANTGAQNLGDVVHDTPVTPPSVPAGMPPMPDFSTLPPLPPLPQDQNLNDQPSGALPPEKLGDIFGSSAPGQTPPPAENNPGQFKIPGQQ